MCLAMRPQKLNFTPEMAVSHSQEPQLGNESVPRQCSRETSLGQGHTEGNCPSLSTWLEEMARWGVWYVVLISALRGSKVADDLKIPRLFVF